APKSWKTKPSGNDSGSLPTASTRSTPTFVSRPGRLDGSYRSFSWDLASPLLLRVKAAVLPGCCFRVEVANLQLFRQAGDLGYRPSSAQARAVEDFRRCVWPPIVRSVSL